MQFILGTKQGTRKAGKQERNLVSDCVSRGETPTRVTLKARSAGMHLNFLPSSFRNDEGNSKYVAIQHSNCGKASASVARKHSRALLLRSFEHCRELVITTVHQHDANSEA
jgi:hypothetical protein